MKKIKVIKKTLKQEKIWTSYKVKFHHKQMRFLISKVALIFNPDININTLIEIEKRLAKTQNQELMFIPFLNQFNQLLNTDYDWESFGKLLWYIYQTSTFYYDQRHQNSNIFNQQNYLEVNQIKRQHYYQWLNSINQQHKGINHLVKQVLKVVF